MPRFRMLVAGAITAGLVVTLVPTADASVVTASNEEQCAQLTVELPDLSALGSPEKFKKSTFKNAAKTLRSAAKGTPANVKAAIKTMADYFDKIGNAGSANAALQAITAKDTAKFTKATIVFDKYVSKVCS
jgi:hypothetical protein